MWQYVASAIWQCNYSTGVVALIARAIMRPTNRQPILACSARASYCVYFVLRMAILAAWLRCDALATLQAVRFDLALIDLRLPGLSGRDMLEAARAQPIMVMTASTLAAEALAAIGAHACLYKPFELDDRWSVTEHIRRG
jgi:CheY-like chemotaxis protein